MPLTVFESSVPVFHRALAAFSNVIDKAAAHAEARKIDPAVFVTARLYPDMLPFSAQVRIACDHAKGASARLAGQQIPKFADNEASLAEFKARIAATLDFIGGIDPGAFDGAEKRDIVFTSAGKDRTLRGDLYLLHYAMPNFYFHVTTGYDILRHNGVEIGKRDFIGTVPSAE